MAKENTLIHRAQNGDEGAFAALMRLYHAFVCTIVSGIIDNSHDAEEVVQDTFLSAYRGLTQLKDGAKFKSWLAEIARNRARNWLREQRGDTVSIDRVSEHLLQTEDSPDERLARQEQRELIRRIMETLPQKDREIARAFYLEGASYKELTSTHGLSDKSISFRLSRARQQLSKRLQYLLTSICIPPGLTLKKIYSGGLTAMKFGTVPKITVGAAALIVLIFIGYIGFRQINAPMVEERVYLSPWEDGTARPRNYSERFPTDTTQYAESGGTQPQIAVPESEAGMESIDDFFDQPDETDIEQFATETEFELDVEQDFTTDISASSESTSQSAEDVMYAYLEAVRSSDSRAMHLLMTEGYRHSGHDDLGDGSSISVRVTHDDGSPASTDEIPVELLEAVAIVEESELLILESLRQSDSQTRVASSRYVGNEFHFQLRSPGIEMPGFAALKELGAQRSGPVPRHTLVKMRKENDAWRIYNIVLEPPEIP